MLGGLLVTTAAEAQIHRELIVALAAKNRLPTIYPYRLFIRSGGLMAYGPDITDEYRRAAWADDRYDRLPKLAAELAHRRVDVVSSQVNSHLCSPHQFHSNRQHPSSYRRFRQSKYLQLTGVA
jgi:hypothetical protein